MELIEYSQMLKNAFNKFAESENLALDGLDVSTIARKRNSDEILVKIGDNRNILEFDISLIQLDIYIERANANSSRKTIVYHSYIEVDAESDDIQQKIDEFAAQSAKESLIRIKIDRLITAAKLDDLEEELTSYKSDLGYYKMNESSYEISGMTSACIADAKMIDKSDNVIASHIVFKYSEDNGKLYVSTEIMTDEIDDKFKTRTIHKAAEATKMRSFEFTTEIVDENSLQKHLDKLEQFMKFCMI